MSLSNPFGKMKVERDSEDENEDFQKVKSNKPSQQLFVAPEQKKKKKRPENTENQGTKIEDEEGFEEVSKHKPQRKKQKSEEGDDFNSLKQNHYAQKEGPKYYPPKNKKPGKREFERKSGTGRGKEISKGGAGGKGTWGNNPKEISRRYEKNNDDYYFEQALNPKKILDENVLYDGKIKTYDSLYKSYKFKEEKLIYFNFIDDEEFILIKDIKKFLYSFKYMKLMKEKNALKNIHLQI